ncbi:MAG: cysteine peptidase family C39 domain-containing protein [Deinococcales bacterium]
MSAPFSATCAALFEGRFGVLFGILLLAAGPGASAVGTARSMAIRARPYLVTDLFVDSLPEELPRVILQRGPRDCGPAALATVLAWRGRPVGEDTVLRQAHLRADGVTLAELARLAAVFELPGAWYAVPASRLGSLPTPFIAHLSEGHYVAVYGLVRGFVLLADPARGLVLQRRARFVRAWSGRVLLLDAALEERAGAGRGDPNAPVEGRS